MFFFYLRFKCINELNILILIYFFFTPKWLNLELLVLVEVFVVLVEVVLKLVLVHFVVEVVFVASIVVFVPVVVVVVIIVEQLYLYLL